MLKTDTFLFTLNPRKWSKRKLEDLDYWLEDIQLDPEGHNRGTWSCGVRKNLPSGSKFFLIRLGAEPRGIVGAGITLSEPRPEKHWDERMKNKRAQFVDIMFGIFEREPLISLEELRNEFPEYHIGLPNQAARRFPMI